MAGQWSVEWSKAGLTQESQVIWECHVSNPSRGDSHGYPKYEREDVLQLAEQVGVTAVAELVRASHSLLTWWRVQLDSYDMTGNQQQEVLTGRDQMLMVMSATSSILMLMQMKSLHSFTEMAIAVTVAWRSINNARSSNWHKSAHQLRHTRLLRLSISSNSSCFSPRGLHWESMASNVANSLTLTSLAFPWSKFLQSMDALMFLSG